MRRNFSEAVKKQARARADGKCEGCGAPFDHANKPEVDHDKEDWEGGEPTIENARVLGRKCCHLKKTKAATDRRTKADRVKRKNEGTWPKSRRPLRSRGFAPSRELDPDT